MANDHREGSAVVSGFDQAAAQAASIPAVAIALAVTGATYWIGHRWWDGAGTALRVVPVFYAVVVLAAGLCAVLLATRARLLRDRQAAWVATGCAVAGVAALAQAVAIMQLDSPLGAIAADGQAALYLIWHAALVVFVGGALFTPHRTRLRWGLTAAFIVAVFVRVSAPAGIGLTGLVDASDAFTSDYQTAHRLLTMATVAALVAWLVRVGRRPTWPQVWIGVLIGLAAADLVVAATAEHLFESIWWSSAALRAAQFAVPATALLIDALRLMRLLHQHEQNLTERLDRERVLAVRLLHDHTGTPHDHQQVSDLLETGAFHPVYQPIHSLSTGQVIAFEALTRFTDPAGHSPDVWFDQAWRCGLGLELELATLDAALAGSASRPAGVAVSVNVSPATIIDPRCTTMLTRIRPAELIVEITEHAAVDDYHSLAQTLAGLQVRGVRIAIDDAGAGFSSLQHVVQLSPDIIKLDMSLTRNIDHDPVRRALTISLIEFATHMGIDLIAEGVETTAELHTLRDVGAHAAQGYLLGRPAPLPSNTDHANTRAATVAYTG